MSAVIRADPNRTVIPGTIVDAVVEVPFSCHPSFAQGYYDRDNAFYLDWDRIARDPALLEDWLDEWVYGLADHAEYVEKGGRFFACPVCVKTRNLESAAWVKGAEVKGARAAVDRLEPSGAGQEISGLGRAL